MKNTLLWVFALIVSMQIHSQEKKITGTVSDNLGYPLPGVNIVVKNTSNGTQTNLDGKYEILVKDGDVLAFTYVGLKTVEQTVGESNIVNVTMEEDSAVLNEVVVTAYGIKREKKALGYAVSEIRTEEVSRRKEGDVARVLSGKAFGVDITNNVANKSGQLTAGEINDSKNWNEWIKSLNHKDFNKMQEKWNFYLKHKISVKATDANKIPLANVNVNFFNIDNEKLFTTKTDALGEASIFVDKSVLENNEYFIIQLVHNENIVGKKITKAHENLDFILNQKEQSNDVDIMFTIDATGSMSDEMNYLKTELQNIFDRLDKSIESKRLGLTFYRDHGDSFVVREFDFSSDILRMKKILNNHFADGGGDYEEAVEEALKISLNKSWNINAKSRLLFLLLDAPPHYTKENVEIIQNQIRIAQEKGIKIIPIVASDANKNVEFLMRFFSVSTNGTYVFLTDDSGIGNDHIEPTNSEYKVEKLNNLIVRLINKYCGV
jgi:hypothetical protein